MGKRRDGREAAVQFLFQNDINAGIDAAMLEGFWALRPSTKSVRDFTEALIRGVLENKAVIDERICKCVANYELNRIAVVDRNILRVGIYEMLFCNDVPPESLTA
jgi:transcription antitermination protein NusB